MIERAHQLMPLLREHSATIEAQRRVPAPVSQALGAAGCYRMLAPVGIGGEEVAPTVFVSVLESLGTADSAAAWTVMTGATTGLLLHYLEPEVARMILADAPEAALSGVFAPQGRATPQGDAYRLTGRWPWFSGCENAVWRMGGALVLEGEGPRRLPSGMPEIRSCFFRAEQSEVHDTWRTSGMRGTGSHDVEVRDVIVPVEHTTCVFADPPQQDSALARFPVFGLLAMGVSAVGLGIARSALDHVTALVQQKPSRGGRRSMAESELVQVRLATAEAEVAAARALMMERLSQCEAVTAAGDPLTALQRAHLRMAATHAARVCASAVQAAWDLAGGSAVWEEQPLQRHLRDIRVLTQHVMVGESNLKAVGRVLLGLETELSML